jgi:hypothetical protein
MRQDDRRSREIRLHSLIPPRTHQVEIYTMAILIAAGDWPAIMIGYSQPSPALRRMCCMFGKPTKRSFGCANNELH